MRTPPYLTSQQALLVQSMRTFVSEEIQPLGALLQPGALARPQFLDLLESLAEFGLPSGAVATDLGGLGLGWISLAHLFEELARGSAELAEMVLANLLAAPLLAARGSLADSHLADVLEGRRSVGFALGSGLSATIQPDGFMLDGTLERLRNASCVDLMICSAEDNEGGLNCFLLDRHADRIDICHAHSSGNTSVPLSQMQVTQAFLPRNRRLGDAVTITRLNNLRKLFDGLIRVAKAQRVLDLVVEQAREPASDGIPPLLTLHLAEMATAVMSARQMILAGLQRLEEGLDARADICMASLLSSRTLAKIGQLAARIDPSHRSLAMIPYPPEHDADAQVIAHGLLQL